MDLEDVAVVPVSDGDAQGFRTEPVPRRIRATLDHAVVVDTDRARYLFESGHLAVYLLPRDDVRHEYLRPSATTTHSDLKGEARWWDLVVGDRVVPDAAWCYEGHPELKDHLSFYWNRLDAWFEEDEEAFVHPRDPYHRVDVLRSSRHVVVSVGGQVLADSHRPSVLVETSLPRRFYLPRADVRLDLLEPSATTTRCPYKGVASYFSYPGRGDEGAAGSRVDDLAWTYPAPIPELPKVEALVCFFDERVDVTVDGVRQERPRTSWS